MAALCSLAEHHLAVHEGAVDAVAGEVEQLASRAATVVSGAAEPVQVLATLRHLQGRPDEALQLLRDSVRFWYVSTMVWVGGCGCWWAEVM